MKRILIGCEILKNELIEIIEKNQLKMDTVWLDEDLHNHPEKLKVELQTKIDELDGYDEVILSYGLCGNAMLGITATHCDLIYPRVEDCITAPAGRSLERGSRRASSTRRPAAGAPGA